MRGVRLGIGVLVVTMVLAWAGAPAPAAFRPVARFSALAVDPERPETIAVFLAAVPASVWHEGGDVYEGVLTHDRIAERSNAYLIEDWATFTRPARVAQERAR